MKNYCLAFLIGIISLTLYSCGKKTDKDRAIALGVDWLALNSLRRYRFLDLKKIKPQFIGLQLSGVAIVGDKLKVFSFNFDKGITKIAP